MHTHAPHRYSTGASQLQLLLLLLLLLLSSPEFIVFT
jgi:hypothetical protein